MYTIEEVKEKVLDGTIEPEIYSCKVDGEQATLSVGTKGFQVTVLQSNGWYRIHDYDYVEENGYGEWVLCERYEKDK